MKKFLSILLAAIMLFAVTASALADLPLGQLR